MREAYREAIDKLVEKRNSTTDIERSRQLESLLLEFFVRYCVFEQQAGYTELAVACFQAEIEYSCCCPPNLNDESKKSLFESFWDSEVARTGEPGALGWSSWLESTFHNNEKDKDAIASSLHDMHEGSVQQVEPKQSLLKWRDVEERRDALMWRPRRSIEEVDDPQSVVLYSDISDILFSIRFTEVKLNLIVHFLELLGLVFPLPRCSNSIWTRCTSNCPSKSGEETMAASQVLHRYPGGFVELFVHTQPISDGSKRSFISNLLKQSITYFPHSMELKVAHIVFLTINLPTVHSNRQISKIEDIISDYLKDSASNPMIWHLYAQFKERTNQRDKAQILYEQALSEVAMDGDHKYFITRALAICYMKAGLINKSLDVLVNAVEDKLRSRSSASQYFGAVNSIRVLKARKAYLSKIDAYKEGSVTFSPDVFICFNLFELLTRGMLAMEDALSACSLIENNTAAHEDIFTTVAYAAQLYRERSFVKPHVYRNLLLQLLKCYPRNMYILHLFIEQERQSAITGRLRRYFDECCERCRCEVMWLLSVLIEKTRAGSKHRIVSIFEKALSTSQCSYSVLLWISYLDFALARHDMENAKRIFFRAIRHVPWCKAVWMYCLRVGLQQQEIEDLVDTMEEKEIRLRINPVDFLGVEAARTQS